MTNADTKGTTRLPAGVLFDMDGTLIDSEPLWMAAERELVAKFGGIWTDDDALALIGNALPESARIMKTKANLPLTKSEILDYLLSSVTAAARANMPWRPGAQQLLSLLHTAGVPCALVTASYRVFSQEVVAAAQGALTALVPGDEVTHGKPDPESYLRAAKKLGADPSRCVAVEDSPPGITAALASGAHTIGIPCVVPVPPRPGLSRLASLAEIDLALLERVVGGEVVDTLAR